MIERWRSGRGARAREAPERRTRIAPVVGQPRISSNRPGWRSARPHPPRTGDECLHLAAPDEPAAAQLDALELAGPGPAADRRRPEADVGGAEDLRRLGEADPVGGGAGHSVGRRDRPPTRGARRCREPGARAASAAGRGPLRRLGLRRRLRSTVVGLGLRGPAAPRSAVPSAPCRAARGRSVAGGCLPCRLELRSFFAQPEPLKWIVGAENALRTGRGAADRAGVRAAGGDAVDHLEPMAVRADVVVGRHRRGRRASRQPRRRRMPHFGQ